MALPPDAQVAGGEFGILEGRSFALLHPLVKGMPELLDLILVQ
jgi:hypothetical protein